MTFLFEYTFNCSNILHSKSPVLFGNQLWPQLTEMSHYLPVLQKVLVFQLFQLFVTIGRFVSEIHDFRYQNIQFIPNLTNSVISSHFSVISNNWNDKILNFFKSSPISFISSSKYTGDIFLPIVPSNILKCHLNVIFYNIQVSTVE